MPTRRQRQVTITVIFATLAVSAFLFAQGSAQLVASSLLDIVPTGSSRAAAAPPANFDGERERRDRLAEARDSILRRNIFDSETGPLDGSQDVAEPDSTEDDAEPEVVDPNAPPPECGGSMRLVIALRNYRSPAQSIAAIAGTSGTVDVYRPGERIDERELVTVQSARVLLREGSGLCHLAMFQEDRDDSERAAPEAPDTVSVERRPPRPTRPRREGAISSEDMDNGIQRTSDTQYTVSRNLVNQILENQAELMRTARIIPHEEGGRTVGVKMYGIRRNSLLGRLGLNNGDMLRTINGFDMTSPNSALEAYARLRNADQLSVSVVRRGQPVTINYNVQ